MPDNIISYRRFVEERRKRDPRRLVDCSIPMLARRMADTQLPRPKPGSTPTGDGPEAA